MGEESMTTALPSISFQRNAPAITKKNVFCPQLSWAAGHWPLQDGEDAEVKAVLQKYQATGALQFLHFTPKALLWRTWLNCRVLPRRVSQQGHIEIE